jgi:Ca2+-binding EF-hand superfamily protein
LLLLPPPPLLQEENERLEMMWLQVDEDRNGTLDRSEVAAVLKKMGLSADDEDVEDAMTGESETQER